MKYLEWQYLFPPRPESAIAPVSIGFYQNMGWVAQYKKNGTNTIIGLSPSGEVITMTRHADQHKAWQISDHLKKTLLQIFPRSGWHVLCAEVMHSKTKDIKNTLYVHDILVFNGDYLINSTFIERQSILDDICIPLAQSEEYSHYVCDDQGKLWYAKLFKSALTDLFWSIQIPELDEGLVLKNPAGKLKACTKEKSNDDWQVKVRHSTKKYPF